MRLGQTRQNRKKKRACLAEASMTALITYKITGDLGGKLKQAARTGCNFWNHFVTPACSLVIRVGVDEMDEDTIAESYDPYKYAKIQYGQVNFNMKYLSHYTPYRIGGTVIHEIGHTLGIGSKTWRHMFNRRSGKFKPKYVAQLPDLGAMLVETEFDQGTRYDHWDEAKFTTELMTGFENRAENVLPVTIGVMALLGHKVKHKLTKRTKLKALMQSCDKIVFSRHREAKKLDVDHYVKTEVCEKVYERAHH
jgi:hypothetical protein